MNTAEAVDVGGGFLLRGVAKLRLVMDDFKREATQLHGVIEVRPEAEEILDPVHHLLWHIIHNIQKDYLDLQTACEELEKKRPPAKIWKECILNPGKDFSFAEACASLPDRLTHSEVAAVMVKSGVTDPESDLWGPRGRSAVLRGVSSGLLEVDPQGMLRCH